MKEKYGGGGGSSGGTMGEIIVALFLVLVAVVAFAGQEGKKYNIQGPSEPAERRAIEILMDESLDEAEVRVSPGGKTISELNGRFKIDKSKPVEGAALDFIDKHRNAFGLKNPKEELKLRDKQPSRDMSFQQTYNGIPVWNHSVGVHLNEDNEIYLIVGNHVPTPDIDTTPLITAEEAIDIAKTSMNEPPKVIRWPKSELVIYPWGNGFKLAFHITLLVKHSRWEFFIDAKDGAILKKEDTTAYFATLRKGYLWDNRTTTVGVYNLRQRTYLAHSIPITSDIQDNAFVFENTTSSRLNHDTTFDNFTTNHSISAWDEDDDTVLDFWALMNTTNIIPQDYLNSPSDHLTSGVNILSNHDAVYWFFKNKLDGNFWAGKKVSFGGVANTDTAGRSSWNGYYVKYARTLPGFRADTTRDLDISAHEVGHGITESYVKFKGIGHSGAINEHISDIWAIMVDSNDFIIGGNSFEINTNGLTGRRDIENPSNPAMWNPYGLGSIPSEMKNFYYTSDDDFGEHQNLGILDKAAYNLITDPSLGPSFNNYSTGRHRVAKLYYKAYDILKDYPNAHFYDLKQALNNAAKSINFSNYTTSINTAFTSVGIKRNLPQAEVIQYDNGQENDLWFNSQGSGFGAAFIPYYNGTLASVKVLIDSFDGNGGNISVTVQDSAENVIKSISNIVITQADLGKPIFVDIGDVNVSDIFYVIVSPQSSNLAVTSSSAYNQSGICVKKMNFVVNNGKKYLGYDQGAQESFFRINPVINYSDNTAPTSAITSPQNGDYINKTEPYIIKGTSSDNAGGSGVRLVEVSTDSGVTWNPATDTSGGNWANWTYTWDTSNLSGSRTIKSRATDYCGKIESPSGGITVSMSTLEVKINRVVTTCPTVTAYVSVKNSNDRVKGLTASNFTIKEDGVTKSPTSFNENQPPIKIVYAMSYKSCGGTGCHDVKSPYMPNFTAEMETTAKSLMDCKSSSDYAEIIKFCGNYQIVQSFTTDSILLKNQITSHYDCLYYDMYYTSYLYDAVYTAIYDAANSNQIPGKGAVIVMADGQCVGGNYSLAVVNSYAISNNIPIYAIGMGNADSLLLNSLINGTGGKYFSSPILASSVYNTIVDDLVGVDYLISYSSSGAGQHNLYIQANSSPYSGGDNSQFSCGGPDNWEGYFIVNSVNGANHSLVDYNINTSSISFLPGNYLYQNGLNYYIADVSSGSWNGSAYNSLLLMNCDQKTGMPTGTYADMSSTVGTTTYYYTTFTPGGGNHCTNGIKDADEAGVDCGGSLCKACNTTYSPKSVIGKPKTNDSITGSTYTITGTAWDGSGTGLSKVEISTNNGSTWYLATGTTSWSYNWALPAENSYTIKTRAMDNAGNVETPSSGVTVYVDKAPTSNIISPTANAIIKGSSYTITGTASDGAGTVNLLEVSTDGGINWNHASGTSSWSYTWPLPADGAHNIRSRATDTAGLIENPGGGIYVTVDNTAPSSVITYPTASPVTGTTYTIRGTAYDAGSGVQQVEVSINNGPWELTSGKTSWSYRWDLPPDGAFNIRSRATDNIGNVESPGTGVNVYVDTAPESSINPFGSFIYGVYYINGTAYTITGTASDGTGTIQSVAVSTDNGVNWHNATVTGTNWSYNWTLPADDIYTIKSKATDEGGFTETSADQADTFQVKVDNTPPASTMNSPGDILSGKTCQLTGTASDSGSGVQKVEVSTNGGDTWSLASGKTAWNYNWALPSDGVYMLKSRATDNLGQVETPGAGTTVTVYQPYSTIWTRQLGTAGRDYAQSVAVDGNGNAYVAGYTNGELDGIHNSGNNDLFVVKYNLYGVKLWTRLLGTPVQDYSTGVCVDSFGNAYVAGYTLGDLNGNNLGNEDIFLVKYDSNGTNLWTRQLGNNKLNKAQGISIDGNGNIYITGYTEGGLDGNTSAGNKDLFIVKYDANGAWQWTRQFGSEKGDYAQSISVDANGNAYVAGYTEGNLPGFTGNNDNDIFIVKYDSDGIKLWADQIGASDDVYAEGVTVDSSGNAYVTGYTKGSLDGNTYAGNEDLFVVKYDTDGNKLWSRQLGANNTDIAQGISLDSDGGVYVAGYTKSGLDGNTNLGNEDVFVVKYDANGNKLWTKQMGSSQADFAQSINVRSGKVYVAGYTTGALENTSAGSEDLFLTVLSSSDFNDYTFPSSSITSPSSNTTIYSGSYNITGTAFDIGGAGVLKVEVSTNGGSTWLQATDTSGDGSWSSWGYAWSIPTDDSYTITSRATDNAGNVESHGPGVTITAQRDTAPPSSSITNPVNQQTVRGYSYTISGTADKGNGSEITQVQVSTNDGSNWYLANGTSSWSYNWILPGDGVYHIKTKATDSVGNIETPSAGINVTVDNTIPVSSITAPTAGTTLSGVAYTITGTAYSATAGLKRVEVSTDGGTTWKSATGTTAWGYGWVLPVSGDVTIKSRAIDNTGNVETPSSGVNVGISPYGSPELQHYNWTPPLSGSCASCHAAPAAFLPAGFKNDDPDFCRSCHNPASMGHEKNINGSYEHSMMVNVTSGESKMPTYGNITAGEYNNQAFANLKDNKVVCVTCHNVMRKTEDYGRVWENTTTTDRITYNLKRGSWAAYGYLKPLVYRDTLKHSNPETSKNEKKYLVNPSEYTYNESAGSITFKSSQSNTKYIYVTLDYPYLRISSQDNNLCSDCHTQATHKDNNCLVCHQAHNSSNVAGIRGKVRTTDLSEKTVSFKRYTGTNSFADGNTTYEGICEVCHTQTKYYRRDGSGFVNHSGNQNYNGSNCVVCHQHGKGFSKYTTLFGGESGGQSFPEGGGMSMPEGLDNYSM